MEVFIGAEALEAGAVTPYGLSADHRRVLPGVYAPKRMQLTLEDRITAAWLWSGRRGVVTGLSASALYGAKWIDENTRIELNWVHNKAPDGVITRRDSLLAGEVERRRGLPVTSVERTAFDLARRGPVGEAVARLDSLAGATRFSTDDVLAVAVEHPRVRGLRRVPRVLDLIDGGAQSPKETWLRLLLVDAGFPRPQTQIRCCAPTVIGTTTSTWDGRTSRWRSSTTASSTAPTPSSTAMT